MNEMRLPPGSGLEQDFQPSTPYWRVDLPGHNFEDKIFVDVIDFIPSYEIARTTMVAKDTVWGEETFDANRKSQDGLDGHEAILVALAKHPAMTRLMSIEHLTLPPSMSTVPNTSFMSTWEHVWGSAIAVRRLLASDGQDPSTRESIVMQLRTLLSDVGKTAFGHLGDWRFQGFGKGEDLHDKDLKEYVRRSGLEELLTHYGFSVDEVIFPDIKDFVECDSPEINVDRLDYTLRERRRYHMAAEAGINWSDAVKLVDGKIVFKTQQVASIFARGNLLLPVMNWQEPAHKLNLHLLVEMVNHVSISDEQLSFGWPDSAMDEYHPYDLMYSHDHDFLIPTFTNNRFLWTVRPIVDQIGRDMRHITDERAHSGMQMVSGGYAHDFDEIGYGGMPKVPPNVQIFDVTGISNPEVVVHDYQRNPNAVDFHMRHLKPRKHTDPLVECEDGQLKRLSELDPNYEALAASAFRRVNADHIGRLLVSAETKEIIETGRAENRECMPELLRRDRMPADIFQRALANSYSSIHKKVDLLWLD
jgi:hypothetical protein